MRNFRLFLYILFGIFALTGCAGMKTLTIQTQEPAQVTLPKNVGSLLIVDNIVGQPDDMGHTKKRLGRSTYDKVSVNTDSLSIVLTEALTQFLSEEEYFDVVMLYEKPLRNDRAYWKEEPITPEKMQELKNETGADAVVSLDKLLVTSDWQDLFVQEGYPYATLKGKISATMRVYLPTLEGQIPTVQFIDSLYWEGFDISDGMAYAEFVIPHAEHALKDLTIYTADKLTYVLTPHWITQERWYYTLPSSTAREAEAFAAQSKWQEASDKWERFYNSSKKKIDKAKTASNIALAYEMLDDIKAAHTWVIQAQELFNESTSSDSLERKRVAIYKTELERRMDNSNKLNMQID
ncbi:MAG: DUF6340 family protein [Dysgonamonadaceae bacterium]|nr:DUF6340 family protein [Dysgonamonadaceae bacterium]MDD4728404.1 DUF6340 family protein [Dysgonamonadaceae bacterium]